MISFKGFSAAMLVGALTLAGFAAEANAHKRAYRHSHGAYCQARVEGRATGQGLFGAGTAQAREFAVADWQSKVADRWGARYANFSNARGVRWDCKKNAILKAKCVVVAMPCR